MEIIIDVLYKAMDVNIAYAVLMCIVLAFLYGANIVLGTILGTFTDKFNAKKFWFGILKALITIIVIILLCYILNVFMLTINLIEGINISEDLVSTLEVLSILITNGIDISKEVIQKIKSFRGDLKFTSYDNVTISDTNIVEPIDFKG